MTEQTVVGVLNSIQMYEDFLSKSNGKLSTKIKGSAVRSVEEFLNRLEFPAGNQSVVKISTSTIKTEVGTKKKY